MAKINSIQSSFLLGEVSPRMAGRTDEQQYNEMLKELVNGVVISQGGVQSRPGTQLQTYTTYDFVHEADSAVLLACTDFITATDKKFRNYAFTTSDGKKWMLVMQTDVLTKWNIYSVTDGVLYPVPGRGDIFENADEGSSFGDITTGALLDFSAIDLDEIQIEKSGDVLFLAHGSSPPLTIRYRLTNHRNAGNNFLFPVIARWDYAFLPNSFFWDDLFLTIREATQNTPFLEKNIANSNGNGYLSYAVAQTSHTSLTITSGGGIFTPAWIGTSIRFTDLGTGKSGFVMLYAYTSPTAMTAFVLVDLPVAATQYGVATDTYWEEAAWSPKNGYPSAVAAYGGRMLYGGTITRPNRIWASAVGDVDELSGIPYAQDADFSTYLNDESRAYSFDIIGCERIVSMSSGKTVFVGATNREFIVQGDNNSITPLATQVVGATNYGSAVRSPLRVGSEILFVQRSKQRIRSLVFSFQEDDYKSQDITKIAEHICRKSRENIPQDQAVIPSFGALAVANSPDTRIWAYDNNGGLSSCTYDRDSGIVAWSRHSIGGTVDWSGNFYSGAFVYSAAVMSSFDGSADEVYLMLKRMNDGVNVVRMEKIGGYFDETAYTNPTFSPPASFPDWLRTRAVFLDGAVGAYEAVATTDFTFDTHPNETVSVLADGAYIGELALDGSGNVTLPEAHNEVIIGYGYNTNVLTMDLEIPGMQMSNQDKQKGTPEVWARFNRTSNAIAQRDGQSDIQRFDFVGNGNQSDAPVDLYTGDKRVHIGDLGRNLSIFIGQDKPLPFELLAIIFQGMIYD